MNKILLLLSLFFIFNNFTTVTAIDNSSYVLMDAVNGRILYEKNKDQRFLTASIAKIMTCMVAIEYGSLFTKYKVDYETTVSEGSSIYLKEGDEVYLYDLLCGLMLRSGNDAATLISKSVFKNTTDFVFHMNLIARRIGMENSTFQNPTGLNRDTFNYSTSYDMALLMKYAVENEIFYSIASKKYHKAETNDYIYHWYNKHKLIANTDYVKAGKTGYTKDSGRTLVSYAEVSDMKLIAVSFNENSHYQLHESLFKKVEEDFSNQIVLEKGVYHQELNSLNYYPYVREDVSLLIKKDSIIKIKFYLLDKPNVNCGYFEIFEDGKLIYKDILYPFYPTS